MQLLKAIFRVEREDDDRRFRKDDTNRLLLFHGTKMFNIMGILTKVLSVLLKSYEGYSNCAS